MKKIDPDKLRRAVSLYAGGKPISEVVSISGIGRSTIYRELDRLGIPRQSKAKR
ncbi:hypothetical protein B5F79_00580 [Olsenella sp. An285]|uniref:helix-turn-helix domain-containing protein n=1 Tax=Olsenella sp. An285 TaxID=1965621 RepID=UPI000B3AC2F9|nr:hypothetical protein B5F79_00580 [Olsenella sp. An285]